MSTSSTDGNDDSTSGSSVLGEATFDGLELKVEVTDDSVAGVNAFRDGEEVGSTDVATGAQTATILEAQQSFAGDEIRFVAVDDSDSEIDSMTTSFSPEPTIKRIRSRAVEEGLEASEDTINFNTKQFREALVTIENTGDGPLFVQTWERFDDAAVFLTSGVPRPADPSAVDDRESDYGGWESVAPGESMTVKAFVNKFEPLDFHTSGDENSEWPAEIREMGDWPDGYADGDTLDVSVVVQDDRGNQMEATTTVTYSGGLYQYDSGYLGGYVAGRVDSQS
jgi:hypothetical protein